MKKILAAAAVFAALMMVSCGTSAEDKAKIEDQAKKITALEKQVGDMQKTVDEVKAKTAAPAPAPTPTPEKAPAKAPVKAPAKTK